MHDIELLIIGRSPTAKCFLTEVTQSIGIKNCRAVAGLSSSHCLVLCFRLQSVITRYTWVYGRPETIRRSKQQMRLNYRRCYLLAYKGHDSTMNATVEVSITQNAG
jgi:hypothetical protein